MNGGGGNAPRVGTHRPFRRRRGRGAAVRLAWTVALAAAGCAAPAPAGVPPRPDVVVLLCDDLGYGDLGCFGHPRIRTPNLDRLAGEGLRLTSCYAAAPVCSPSRAGLLTGRAPQREGIVDWIRPGSDVHLVRGAVTVARLLKEAGYATCMAGKWHLSGKLDGSQPTPADHGFDHWMATENNARPGHLNPDNFRRNGAPVGPLRAHASAVVVDEALSWLRERRGDQPIFLYLAFHAPHEPVAAGADYIAAYADVKPAERATYYADVTQTDAEIGRLLAGLDACGRGNALVLFTSDNGPETLNRYPGAAHSYGSPGPLRGMKLHLYEGGIRVPGIVRWRGVVRPGAVRDDPVCGLDLLPTLCEVAGAPFPGGRALDGTSLVSFLRGGDVRRERPLYWQYDFAISAPKTAVREGRWKLAAPAGGGPAELFDLEADAAEVSDRAAREPAVADALRGRLERLRREVSTP